MTFFTARVTEPDKDDWKKSLHLMSHLKDTVDSSLTLEADDLRSLRWLMDAAHAVHHDMKGHTGAGLTSGKGLVHSNSVKQKINGKSSTEIESIGFDDVVAQVSWTNHFVEAQGWSVTTKAYQDNRSAMSSEHNGRLSSGNRTKHTNVRHCFVKDCIDQKEFTIEHLGTDEMWSDCFTKPLQGEKFIKFRKTIVNL